MVNPKKKWGREIKKKMVLKNTGYGEKIYIQSFFFGGGNKKIGHNVYYLLGFCRLKFLANLFIF